MNLKGWNRTYFCTELPRTKAYLPKHFTKPPQITSDDGFTKVYFSYYSKILEEYIIETMWAQVVDEEAGIYRLDSIPFYGPLIATGDEFSAEFDQSTGMMTFLDRTKKSGNSVVQVVVTKAGYSKEIIRTAFKKMGCFSEGVNERFFAMEVLKEQDYSLVKQKLEQYAREGVLEYAEPCLSEKHRGDLRVEKGA